VFETASSVVASAPTPCGATRGPHLRSRGAPAKDCPSAHRFAECTNANRALARGMIAAAIVQMPSALAPRRRSFLRPGQSGIDHVSQQRRIMEQLARRLRHEHDCQMLLWVVPE
jgi:hypothetical protein